MDISLARLAYFSPTGTTKRVLEGIAQGVQADVVEALDLTPPEARRGALPQMHGELTILGAPVYAGRIPPEAAHRLRRLRANGTPAVVVVVYGNREYEDALLELRDFAVEVGFRPIAGGAFIGEHSFDSEATPIATGRPDAQDLRKSVTFGQMIRDKMEGIHALDEIPPLQVPGDLPYRERMEGRAISPVSNGALCTKCEGCVAVCPMAAITVGDNVVVDQNECILCSACVKACASGAMDWQDPWVMRVAKWLSTDHGDKKEPEMYL